MMPSNIVFKITTVALVVEYRELRLGMDSCIDIDRKILIDNFC